MRNCVEMTNKILSKIEICSCVEVHMGCVEGHICAEAYFLLEPKLVFMSKMKHVSKLKTRPLGKVVLGGAGTLIALNAANDEILLGFGPYFANLALFGQNVAP